MRGRSPQDPARHDPTRYLLPLYGAHARARRAALIDHPATVNLKEDVVLQPLNAWIGFLVASENVDQTVAALAASQGASAESPTLREGIKAAH